MWIFAGLLVLTAVVGYWLRLIARALIMIGAIHEATVNRAATIRGDKLVSDDIDPDRLY